MMLPTSERYLGLLKLAARNSQQLLSPVPDPSALNGFSFPGISELGISTRDAFADLDQLAELGYVDRQFAERGYFCWQCGHHALLFREVCPSCTSSNVEVGDLLHHFRCCPQWTFPAAERNAAHDSKLRERRGAAAGQIPFLWP